MMSLEYFIPIVLAVESSRMNKAIERLAYYILKQIFFSFWQDGRGLALIAKHHTIN